MNYVGSPRPSTPRNPRNFFYLSVDNNNKIKQSNQNGVKVPEVISVFDFDNDNSTTRKYR